MNDSKGLNVEYFFKSGLQAARQYRGGKSKPRENAAGAGPIFKLSSNENPIGPSPLALQAIQDQLLQLHEYPDNDDLRLRQALNEYHQNVLSQDHFICGPSASELIEIIMRGCLKPGNEIIICSPTFLPYRVFAEKLGGKVLDVPLVGSEFSLDVEKILLTASKNTRLIFLGSPNNPTGQIIKRAELDALTSRLPSHVILVLDEVYHHFVTDEHYCTAMPFVEAGKNVIGLNTFSKAFGLAGLRLGYAYAPKQIADYLRLLCKPFYLSNLAIDAGIAALADIDFVDTTVALVKEERSYLSDRLRETHIKFWPSQGNFVLFKLPIGYSFDFEERMFSLGVMIRPLTDPGYESYFRVSIGNRRAMDAFLRALQVCLK